MKWNADYFYKVFATTLYQDSKKAFPAHFLSLPSYKILNEVNYDI